LSDSQRLSSQWKPLSNTLSARLVDFGHDRLFGSDRDGVFAVVASVDADVGLDMQVFAFAFDWGPILEEERIIDDGNKRDTRATVVLYWKFCVGT
jgi:hypothetical protein